MESLQNLSHDELTLVGCFVALLLSFGLVSGSYHLRHLFRSRPVEIGRAGASVAHPSKRDGDRSTTRRAA